MIEAFLEAPLAERLGWVFLHFLWQGALVAGLLALALLALGRTSDAAHRRYLACCAALLAMVAFPAVTFSWIEPETTTLALSLEQAAAFSLPHDTSAAIPALTLFWALGALVQQTRLLVAWIGVQRLRRRFLMPAPERWADTVAVLARKLDIRAPVRISESALARVPTVVGWLRPVILVPTAAFLHLSPAELRTILAHELAHVRRHDYLVNLVQSVIESLLFFHPAVWWLSHRLRVEREYCCDDVAVRLCGDALTHARALERLESLRASGPGAFLSSPSPSLDPGGSAALSSTGGSLMQRIERLVRPEAKNRRGSALGIVPAALAVTGVLSASALGWAPDEGKPEGAETVAAQDDTDPLEARVRDLRRQIADLEKKLEEVRRGDGEHGLRREQDHDHSHEEHVERRRHRDSDARFGFDHESLGRDIHEHVRKLLEEHDVRVERRGDGGERGESRLRIQTPQLDVEFDPEELRRKIHEGVKKHLYEFDFERFMDQHGQDVRLGIQGEGFDIDPEELKRSIQEDVLKYFGEHDAQFEHDRDTGRFEFRMKSPDVRIGVDKEQLEKHLRHFEKALGEDFAKNFEFDHEAFREHMKSLKEHMQRFKGRFGNGENQDFQFHFDPEQWKQHAEGFELDFDEDWMKGFDFDFGELHDRIQDRVHRHLDRAGKDGEKLHGHEFDAEELHRYLRESLKGLETMPETLKGLEKLKELEGLKIEIPEIRVDGKDLEVEADELHRHLKGLHHKKRADEASATEDDWV